MTVKLEELLELDVDEAAKVAAAFPPSHARKIFLGALAKLRKRSKGDPSRALAILQATLAGSAPVVSSREALDATSFICELVARSSDPGVQCGCVVALHLLLYRISVRDLQKFGSFISPLKVSRDAPAARLVRNLRRDLRQKQASALGAIVNPDRQRAALRDALDLRRAAKHASSDALGDWYKDPWGWPEVAWIGRRRPTQLIDQLIDPWGDAQPLDVPKEHGGNRPAVILNPTERVFYQALVDALAPGLLFDLPSWVFGSRLSRFSSKALYANGKFEWAAFQQMVSKNYDEFRCGVHVDIQAFFSSVRFPRLLASIERSVGSPILLDTLNRLLEAWFESTGRSGLPQRCLASSALAQVMLRPIDQFLDRSVRARSIRVVRWMDDFWLFSNDERSLELIVGEIEELLRQLGLQLNSTKTSFFERGQAAHPFNPVLSSRSSPLPRHRRPKRSCPKGSQRRMGLAFHDRSWGSS